MDIHHSPNGRRLYGLDALRGIAALAVALHHLARIYDLPIPPLNPGVSVDFFFILSGFVMSRTYEQRLLNRELSPTRFLMLRWRRLITPLAVGTTIGLAWAISSFGFEPDMLPAFAIAFTFLPAFWMADVFPFDRPAWSLFLEISLNALHGQLLARRSLQELQLIFLLASVGFVWLRLTGRSEWAPDLGSILTLFPRGLACYLLGIILYRRYGDAPLGNSPYWALAAFVGCLAAASYSDKLQMVITLTVAPVILRTVICMKPNFFAAWVGGLSYPLYAVHESVIRSSALFGLQPITALFLSLALAAILALQFERARTALSPGQSIALRTS